MDLPALPRTSCAVGSKEEEVMAKKNKLDLAEEASAAELGDKLKPETVAAELTKLFKRACAAGDFSAAAKLSGELRAYGVSGLSSDVKLDDEAEILDSDGVRSCPRCGQRLRPEVIRFKVVRDPPPGKTPDEPRKEAPSLLPVPEPAASAAEETSEKT
jgi:hypothetical protein